MYILLFILLVVESSSAISLRDTLTKITNTISDTRRSSYFGSEDAYLGIIQLAEKYGYPIETHSVITEDGYVLIMHRISKGRNVNNIKKVVYLMHGILESSDNWVLLGPKKALPYMLADRGYDVWLGNTRGNKYSLLHKIFNKSMPQFWNFTWEEMGLYDLPAMLDYIIDVTGKKKIYYVGISQGTTIFFVMNSMRPEYNEKIVRMIALAPQVFMRNARHVPLKILSQVKPYYSFLFKFNSLSTGFLNGLAHYLCAFISKTCDSVYTFNFGHHNVKESMWPLLLKHTASYSSTLQILHYGQLVHSKRFCRYDFDKEKNMQKYGQPTPPDYNLKLVTSPVVLFYCDEEQFSDRQDIEFLKSKLLNVAGEYSIDNFTHIDFMYSDKATTLIYPNIIQEIK